MVVSGKRILVIVIIIAVVLVSLVIAGAVSIFNKSSPKTANYNDKMYLNATLNNVVNFCIKSLPNGTALCDNKLGSIINEICHDVQQSLDVCHNGKVAQYYKLRNNEIMKKL